MQFPQHFSSLLQLNLIFDIPFSLNRENCALFCEIVIIVLYAAAAIVIMINKWIFFNEQREALEVTVKSCFKRRRWNAVLFQHLTFTSPSALRFTCNYVKHHNKGKRFIYSQTLNKLYYTSGTSLTSHTIEIISWSFVLNLWEVFNYVNFKSYKVRPYLA